MRKIYQAIRFLVMPLLLTTFLAPDLSATSEELGDMPCSIGTAQELADWLSSEFKYQWKLNTRSQSAAQTILSKNGNCKDFAVLASAFLSKIGVKNDIAIVSFKDLNISHAICVWKDTEESYSFISNRSLFKTGKRSLEDAIERYYPDWEKIVIADSAQQYIRVIRRR